MKKIFWPDFLSDGNPKLGLERIKSFLNALGNPEKNLPHVFHIAGTNGKGSTTAFLKYILEAEGYLVHRYISPHLVEFNERIEVSGKIITDDYLTELANECRTFAEKNNLVVSYFEGITIMAILAFSRNPAIASVVEVGLGGRLDATNIIPNSLVSIITSISLDHMKILGDTTSLIAREKAGIVKENGILIIDKQEKEAYDVIRGIGEKKHNRIFGCGKEWTVKKLKNTFLFEGFGKELELPTPSLEGGYQIYNAGGAIAALLSQNKIKVSDESIVKGLKNTVWPARLQNLSDNEQILKLLPKNTEVILDGAHNEDAAKQLTKWINSKKDNKFNILIIGMLQRKDSYNYIKNLNNVFDMTITVKILHDETSKNSQEFREEFLQQNYKNVIAKDDFIEALNYIGNNFQNNNNLRVVIAGSLYLAGEVLEYAKFSY
ncbi:MAG: bifunctional folylpolyglutamate synthase/dihydrofolate synthase [Rickettsiales bacterium]|nr:bifunctional folylpolyglutamate synthase/dihydrofolate synthase [Rickettsiales bacterium]